MPMALETDATFHSSCFACGESNKLGLRLKFTHGPAGSSCTVSLPGRFQSYEGVVHGGIVATLVDAAMVHALRTSSGNEPLTCRLEIKYFSPLPAGQQLTVRGRRTITRGKVVLASADILCAGVCCARARGAFVFNAVSAPGGER
jgi:uncharacterized protein (TIGR00369 family)